MQASSSSSSKVAAATVAKFIDKVDVNHDGVLSFEEFLVFVAEHYTNPKMHHLFFEALEDCEAKQQIKPKDVIKQFYHEGFLSHDFDDVYEEAWSTLDTDESGTITKPEMRAFVKYFIQLEDRDFNLR